MEDKNLDLYARCEPVPFVVHESDMARMARQELQYIIGRM